MVLINFEFLVLFQVKYNVAKLIESMTISVMDFSYVSYKTVFLYFVIKETLGEKETKIFISLHSH